MMLTQNFSKVNLHLKTRLLDRIQVFNINSFVIQASKYENLDLGATSESSGGSRRLAKMNKAPSPSSGSTSSTGSSGGKDKLKKVLNSPILCLDCFVRVFFSAATIQCFSFSLKELSYGKRAQLLTKLDYLKTEET